MQRRRRRDQPRRHPDADLHLGHDRAAQGRATLTPRSHGCGQGDRGDHPARAGRTGDLVAARRPTSPSGWRTTTSRSIYAGIDHDLPEPARGPLIPAAGPSHLVLRRPADLGEAEGRAGGDAGRPARGTAQTDPGRNAGVDRARPAQAARRAGSRGTRGAGRPGRRGDVLEGGERCSGSIRSSRSTSAPRRRRSRCSSSSTRSGSSWPSCGGCRRRAGSGPVNRPGRGQDRDGRAAVARRRAQARRRRRGACQGDVRDARLPQPAREDGRGDRRRRLAAHRRHRRRSTTTATSRSSTARRS